MYVFKKVVAPAQTITAVSNNVAWGTVSLLGTTITASPKSGYRVVAGDGGYTVTAGTATVVNNGDNTFTVTPSSDCTVQINFEAIPTHKANFSVNGVVSPYDVQEGADIDFPADPADLGGKKFVGWATTTISGTTNEKPDFVSSAKMETEDVTYYAVFATAADGGAATATLTANSSWNSYQDKEFTDDKGNTWTANCAGQNQSGTYCYGLNGGTSYLSSPVFPGNVTAVKVTAYNGSGSATRTFTLKKGDTEVGTISVAPSAAGDELTASLNGTAFNQFGMTSSAALQFHTIAVTYSVVSYSAYCTSVTVPLTISDAGYATFCSTSALDFSDVDDVTAYTASLSGSTVTFNKVTGSVPSGTGLLLKGDAGTYDIPVVASSTTDVSGNKLVGVTAATEIDGTSGENAYYVLQKKGENVGFYRVTNAAYTVRANSAYLEVPVTAAKDFIGFGDDKTTSLNLNANENFNSNATMYNLRGQRVSESYKGIVIKNGRKFINK